MIRNAKDIAQLGAIMFVGAHPDDELFTAGGILAAAVRNKQRVRCVSASRGESGAKPGWPADMIGEIRTLEQAESMAVLGVREQIWLGYQDGYLDDVDAKAAVASLKHAITEFKPDSILTFGPDGLTGHPDHCAVSKWTNAASHSAQIYWAVIEPTQYEQLREVDRAANIFFKINQPPLVRSEDCAIDLKLPAELAKLKRMAFEAVPSQMQVILAAKPFARPGEALARECFVKATK